MNTGSTLAGDRRRLAVCLVVAGALHAVVLPNVNLPEARLPDPMPTIALELRQKPFEATRPRAAAVETANTEEVPGADLDEAVSARSPIAAPAAVEPLSVPSEIDRDAGPSRSGLADATTYDLARAIAAQAEALSAPHPDATETDGSSPRVRRLTGPPSGDPELAYYLDSWRRKVERVGNINYPSEARSRGLSGTLRLLVVIDRDGALQDARILESSGHKLLDEGAVGIVNLAAPFSPFTKSMRARIDLLEIERRWRFRKDRLTPMP
ncbi:MAG: energy transducer TonB [Gammaproteobacteria bacterium]|nr:energy transducer TonB [Gammaproteobacteria bacterium]MDE0036299.1 energy transducer TonB [Gammaproteobacteria bacterium]MDE0177123.1 energy transducer TonB [Gammaproteobacteria bacterium]MDE0444419.1 energy transducer TonB [Gammaproteobacteria bacterium]